MSLFICIVSPVSLEKSLWWLVVDNKSVKANYCFILSCWKTKRSFVNKYCEFIVIDTVTISSLLIMSLIFLFPQQTIFTNSQTAFCQYFSFALNYLLLPDTADNGGKGEWWYKSILHIITTLLTTFLASSHSFPFLLYLEAITNTNKD